MSNSVKSKTILIILSYLFGILGADRMYLGCYGSGIAKLLTFGGFGIWYGIDLLLITLNAFEKSSSASICSNYVWEKASINQAYYVALVIMALFVLKLLFGALWSIPFANNMGNNHTYVNNEH